MIDRTKNDKEFRRMTHETINELNHAISHELRKDNGPKASGLYALYLKSSLIYIGSTKRTLRQRLNEHVKTLEGRKGLALEDMSFSYITYDGNKARYFEFELTDHYLPEWNKSGFGNADPDRSLGISKWHTKYPLIDEPPVVTSILNLEDWNVDESESDEIVTLQAKGQ